MVLTRKKEAGSVALGRLGAGPGLITSVDIPGLCDRGDQNHYFISEV